MSEDEYTGQEDLNDNITDKDIEDLITRAESAEDQNTKLNHAMNTLSAGARDSNFLHLQISTQELLERLEHFYRGDYQSPEDGDLIWKAQTDKALITFNEFGVTSMMEIVSKYIDKNTILSYYKEERIYEILSDLGDELVLFLLCNHVQMGMDTYFKKTKFRMIIITTLHVIESCYRRSVHGRTLDKLNETTVRGEFGTMTRPNEEPIRREGFFAKRFNR